MPFMAARCADSRVVIGFRKGEQSRIISYCREAGRMSAKSLTGLWSANVCHYMVNQNDNDSYHNRKPTKSSYHVCGDAVF